MTDAQHAIDRSERPIVGLPDVARRVRERKLTYLSTDRIRSTIVTRVESAVGGAPR